MKRLLLAAAFLSLFVADIKETKAVDCSSPVWKNHSSCRDKETGSKKSTVRSSNNDLGGADLGGPNTMASPKLPSVVPSGKISGEEYKAYCGLPTEKCSVSFKNDRLAINDGLGLGKEQLKQIETLRSCRQAGGCFRGQWDYDYLITYQALDGFNRQALIAFRPGWVGGGRKRHKRFFRDIQIWSNTPLALKKAPGTVMSGNASNLGGVNDGSFGRALGGIANTLQQQQQQHLNQMNNLRLEGQMQNLQYNQHRLEMNQLQQR